MRQHSIFYSRADDLCLELGKKWRHKGTRMDSGLRIMASNQYGATNTWRGRSQKDENGYGMVALKLDTARAHAMTKRVGSAPTGA